MRRSVSVLVLCASFIAVSATAAQARLSIDPRRVDFGEVPVGCWETDSCPTELITITNTGKKPVQLLGAMSCGYINPRFGCENDPGSWGGILDDGALGQCFGFHSPTPGVLAPGASCSFTIVGSPQILGTIRGYLVLTNLEEINDIVIRLPVTIVGT